MINGSGQYIAVVAPSLPAASIGPAVHQQAMKRIREQLLLPVREFPSVSKKLTARERADDINEASADPLCRAIFAVAGGDDAITLLKYLDREVLAESRVPFVGYSDNTALHNLLWTLGRSSFYGGSTQVQIGAGPYIDDCQKESLLSILNESDQLVMTTPETYEVRGVDWQSPRALVEMGKRVPFPEFIWAGKPVIHEGKTWGGCLQTLIQLAIMGEIPPAEDLSGVILFVELSDDALGDGNVRKLIRAFGEAGYFNSVGALLVSRPPHSFLGEDGSIEPDVRSSTKLLHDVSAEIDHYNSDLLRVLGLPIGHLRPQYIIPYGGRMEVDGVTQKITAYY